MKRVIALTILLLLLLLMGCDTKYGGFESEEEPNNSFSEANEFQGVNISWSGAISTADDQDFYKIYLDEGKKYEFILDNLQWDLNFMLYVSEPTIDFHSSSDNPNLENEVITLDSAPYRGWYYLLVEKSSHNASGNYFGKYVVNLKKIV